MKQIGTIISYCTNDYRFIDKCIAEAKLFSSQIIVVVSDHFFDGTKENRHLLNHTYANHPDCKFIEFAYMPDRIYSPYHNIKPQHREWAIFWAASARYIGLHYLDPKIDSILFLDSDEIVDGKAFLAWHQSGLHSKYDAMRFASYLYALKPTLRAKKVVNLPFFVKRKTLSPLTLMNELERIGAYIRHRGPKREEIVGLNGFPFVHHYSWVRTLEECLWKAKTWGHRNDENWPKIIEESFLGKTKNLFASGHEFEEIEKPYFDPFQISYPSASANQTHSHVIKITQKDLRKKEIEALI